MSKSTSLKWRFDSGIELGEVTETDSGYLIVTGKAAVEDVLLYIEEDGSERRELVPAETLKSSTAQLEGKPLTNEHPDRGEVVDENWKEEAVGSVIEAEFEGGVVKVRVRVNAKKAKEDVRAGKRQLSPGYEARVEKKEEDGEHPDHGEYDLVQVERYYNHLALTKTARNPDARIRLDSKGHVMDGEQKKDAEDGEGLEGSGEMEESEPAQRIESMLENQSEKMDEMAEALKQLTAVLEEEKPAEEEEGGEEEPAEEEAGGEEGSSPEGRMDWFEERHKALQTANRAGADLSSPEDMEVVEIKRKAVEAQTGKRLDSRESVKGAFDLLSTQSSKQGFGDGAFLPKKFEDGEEQSEEDRFSEPESRKKQREQFS